MALRFAVLKNVFDSYCTKAFPLFFLFFALIYFILKEKKEQRSLLIYEIFGILLLVTPFIGNKIVTLKAGAESNWPVYAILCAVPITAYVGTELFLERIGRKERAMFLLFFILFLQFGFGVSVTDGQFVAPVNLQKNSKEVIEIAEQFSNDREWYVMAPKEIAGQLREYNSRIRVFYDESYQEMQKDLDLLQKEASFYGCNAIILEKDYNNGELMSAGEYQKRAEIGQYYIYIDN